MLQASALQTGSHVGFFSPVCPEVVTPSPPRIAGANYPHLDKLIKHKNIVNHIKAQRLSWFGHVQRMPDTTTVKKIFKWNPLTKISQGRPKYRWEDIVKQDICQMRVKN